MKDKNGRRISGVPIRNWIAGALLLLLTGIVLWTVEHRIHKIGWVFDLVPVALLFGLVPAWMLLARAAESVAARVQQSMGWVAALPVCSVFFAWFIFRYGNDQFGGWDYSILVDTGWREIHGQRPYVDFITPNPPSFNLGVWGAFRLFGVHWNSQLYAIALVCVVSFLWIYWLLRRISASRLLALFLAFSVETLTVLAVCFWWYNDTSELAATVFLLSCLVCMKSVRVGWREWSSYSIALALVLLAKPNVAGLMVVCYVPLLIAGSAKRLKALAATAAGVMLALGTMFAAHVSVAGMLVSYRAVAIERGGLHFFGVQGWSKLRWGLFLVWFVPLIAPVFWITGRLREEIRTKNWKETAYVLGLILPVPLAFYFILTNAEAKESETAILLVTLGIALIACGMAREKMRRFFVAMAVWVTVVCLYFGVSRARVYGIGPFYERTHNLQPLRDGFFEKMETTDRMMHVENEVRRAKASYPGPIFLGPRLEFGYADLDIPSPRGWPVYYQPGTSFARRDVAALTAVWRQQHFGTLIFLHGDRTFYPQSLLDAIDQEYVPQPGFSEVDVYTRR